MHRPSQVESGPSSNFSLVFQCDAEKNASLQSLATLAKNKCTLVKLKKVHSKYKKHVWYMCFDLTA